MFPIRDHNPSGRTPYVTYGLIAANVLAFLLYLSAMNDPAALNRLYMTWGAVPAQISQGHHLIALATSMFLHGGLMHLAGNMLFLFIFGDNLEDEMGHVPYFLFYMIAGVGAAALQVLSAPGSTVPIVGASGAIAGVMGGYLLLYPKARIDILIILLIFFRVIPIPAWIMMGVWLGFQFIGGLGSDPDAGGVAYWAHAGGFAIGFVLTIPTWLRVGGPAFWTQTHGHPPHPEAHYRLSTSRIPRIPRRK